MKTPLRVRQTGPYEWLIPKQGKMRVDGVIYADRHMMDDLAGDEAVQQVANVACLPGIVGRSIGMPDIHWGYGFAIGGVAAFDPEAGGVISPGGVGYDINCGVRLLRSGLGKDSAGPHMAELMNQIQRDIPAGVGSHYRGASLGHDELHEVLAMGAGWAVQQGLGVAGDLAHIESSGALTGARPDWVSDRALARGRNQLGTVGSGNHFIEIGFVGEIYLPDVASAFGLELGGVTVLIHSGSRGLGHQVCTDHLDVMLEAAARYEIELPDRQLACAPLGSPEGERYMGAMNAAANFAFANRQVMAHKVRLAFEHVFGTSWSELGMDLVYDVAHNNAKWETHTVEGRDRKLCVHRKGATRAFPPGHEDLPQVFKSLGQPVLIPGDMGRYSYVLVGTRTAYDATFGSTCHGAGRLMSRRAAAKQVKKNRRDLAAEFRELGVEVRAASYATLAEEIPEAYKDVAEVVDVVDQAGIGRKVAKLVPLGVLKG